jgi:3-hydroxyacyl-CoA dehydrogenase
MKKLKFTSTIQDLVVHILELKAIIESEAIKKKIFIELDKILQPSATLLPYKRLLKCTLE